MKTSTGSLTSIATNAADSYIPIADRSYASDKGAEHRDSTVLSDELRALRSTTVQEDKAAANLKDHSKRSAISQSEIDIVRDADAKGVQKQLILQELRAAGFSVGRKRILSIRQAIMMDHYWGAIPLSKAEKVKPLDRVKKSFITQSEIDIVCDGIAKRFSTPDMLDALGAAGFKNTYSRMRGIKRRIKEGRNVAAGLPARDTNGKRTGTATRANSIEITEAEMKIVRDGDAQGREASGIVLALDAAGSKNASMQRLHTIRRKIAKELQDEANHSQNRGRNSVPGRVDLVHDGDAKDEEILKSRAS
jgi:hypothetical protein